MRKIDLQNSFNTNVQSLHINPNTNSIIMRAEDPPRKGIDKIFGFNKRQTPISSTIIESTKLNEGSGIRETLSHYTDEISSLKREIKVLRDRNVGLENQNKELLESLETRKDLMNTKVIEENENLKKNVSKLQTKIDHNLTKIGNHKVIQIHFLVIKRSICMQRRELVI